MRPAWLMLAYASTAFAQTTAPSDAVLATAKQMIAGRIGNLPKYTCTALINRTYLQVTRGAAAGCDKILGNRHKGIVATKTIATDRLRLDVEITDTGNEIFSWPDAAKFDAARVEDMADGGPIGTGSFGSFLIDIFKNPATQFVYQGRTAIDGVSTFEYRFRVPVEASHYEVGANGAFRLVGYDGSIWVDAASSELVHVEVRTGELAPETGACQATTRVDLQRLHIGQGDYLAPKRSVLGVVGRYGSDSESVTTYSACHEFRGESAITFGDVGSSEPPSATFHAGRPGDLPVGLPISLTFETPIDTGVTAAGDPLTARVLKAVVDPATKKTVIAAGTLVKGRVVHLEHRLEGKETFLLSVVFEEPHLIPNHPGPVAWVDKTTPCWQSLRKETGDILKWSASQKIESQGRLSSGGTFLLPSNDGRYVMPKGCVSEWVTTK